MRRYWMTHGTRWGIDNWPGCEVTTNARIREALVLCFRDLVYGWPANGLIWHADGFMGEARDNSGNYVMLEQINAGGFCKGLPLAHADPGARRRYEYRGPLALLPARREVAA